MQFNKVLVVGLGQLGLPAAKYVKEQGFEVYGFDASVKAIERAERTIGIKSAVDFGDFDVYIICISTHAPEDMSTPKIEGVLSIAERISKDAIKDGALVAIESTIPNGTSQKVFDILSHRLHVVHAPHRWYALEEREHGVNQLRVMGGVCDCCLKAGMQFYNGTANYFNTHSTSSFRTDTPTLIHDSKMSKHNSLGIPMHPVSAVEIAETTKIVENAHRYLQIAFAEELYLYCQVNNLSFPELRDALNTKWNVNILEPREGIGGHCLPKDTKMFLQSSKSKSKIMIAATHADQEYKLYRTRLNNTRSMSIRAQSEH
jgi:UDP-N-acetyl-D-mannosaminuronate dehydrogenase